MPAKGLGSSTTAFSVSTSARTWFSVTVVADGDVPGHDLGLGQALARGRASAKWRTGRSWLREHRSTSWRMRSASGRK